MLLGIGLWHHQVSIHLERGHLLWRIGRWCGGEHVVALLVTVEDLVWRVLVIVDGEKAPTGVGCWL